MAKTFRSYEPDQLLLMPPSLQDWVPDGHLARLVSDVVDALDLTAIEETYQEERGYPPYDPRMMVKLLVYGYSTGVYSSRRMAGALQDSVAFRFLAAGNDPDFRTISDFRKRHGAALAGLFDQVLQVCRESGLVKLGRVAIDGTKIKANASKHKAMSYGRMKQKESETRRLVKELLQQAERVDAEEDRKYGRDKRGDELPADLATHEGRLKKIREAKAALEAEARRRAAAEGKDPTEARPADKAQRNFTDPESRIQKTSDGFIQGYNAQVAVDEQFQIIVAQHVTPVAPDVGELIPAVERIEDVLGSKPEQVLADAGYWSEENVRALEAKGIEPFIATGKKKHGPPPTAPRGRTPQGLTIRERMARKLCTKRGRGIYSWRHILAEPVIGQIKQARGFRQFMRRGAQKVGEEWAMVCLGHNLRKLHTALGTV